MRINQLDYRYRVDAWDHDRGIWRRVFRSPIKRESIAAARRLRVTRIIDNLTEERIR